MQCAQFVCVLLVAAVLVISVDGRKGSFSSRRKSGSSRRGSSTSTNHKQPPPAAVPATPHRTDSNTPFLNSERAGTHGSGTVNTHYRDPFNNKPSAPESPKQSVPHTNGPIGFEGLNNQGSQKIGFDNVHNKPAASNVPSAPAYPNSPARPVASAPAGPPPAYPGYSAPGGGSAAHVGGYEPPPAYPGRPVNAPPVYSPNNPSYPQKNPSQPGIGGYPVQQGGFQQSAYPQQQGNYPRQSYSGQQGVGYPNTGNNFGNYPNQGYNQGFGGSNPSGGFGNSYQGGFGQPNSGFGGNPYGGSPFGQSNSFGGGGTPFSSGGYGGFGGGSGGGFGGNNHYTPNNFGYSSNPGFFGSSNQGYSGNNYGYHKKSRFGGLPIPIPIPIPIPMGGFGGFGGRSHNHRVLDTFVKNQTVNTSDNETTSVFILNNSTVTPCTTDQFIYDSLNVTVMSCTAGNCTAIKVFVTTYVSNQASVHSAGITMCLEPNATFSTFADNVVPTVSKVHKYWMRVCKDITAKTENVTEGNVTVKITEIPAVNVSESPAGNTTTDQTLDSTTSPNIETTTVLPILDNSTTTGILNSSSTNTTLNNSTLSANSSLCETFECSWIEMCLPAVELVDRCASPNCPFTRTGYQPCVRIKMCKSPNTPISTFATLNTTISRIDELNNVTSVNDVANLTLISYITPTLSTNCSQNATDPSCQQPSPPNIPQQACTPSNSTEVADGSMAPVPGNITMCALPEVTNGANSTGVLNDAGSSTTESSTTPIR